MQTNRYQIMVYVAVLAAQAVIISILEGFIPSPLSFAPGAKIGLANLITIIAIFTLPFRYSLQVVVIRVLVTALLGGTFSTFIYSLTGGLLSYFMMILAQKLGPKRVSIVGISVLGGISHNFGQLTVAAILAKSFAVLNYLPALSFSGIIAGFTVGFLGNFLLSRVSRLQLYHQQMAERKNEANWLEANPLDFKAQA